MTDGRESFQRVWNAYNNAKHAYERRMAQDRKTRSHGADPGELKPGKKADADKPRVDLIPGHVVEWLGWALQYGSHKYGEDEANHRNWRHVASRRLYGSVIRHLMAWEQGVIYDEESGLPHLAHALCTLMQLCDNELERGQANEVMATIRSATSTDDPQDVG